MATYRLGNEDFVVEVDTVDFRDSKSVGFWVGPAIWFCVHSIERWRTYHVWEEIKRNPQAKLTYAGGDPEEVEKYIKAIAGPATLLPTGLENALTIARNEV